MHDRAGLGMSERFAQRLPARLGPGRRVGGSALTVGDPAGRSPLVLLGRREDTGEPPVIVEQIVAGVETDQAAGRHSGDIAADLDDVVFELADALARSGTGPGSAEAWCERDRRAGGSQRLSTVL